MSVSPSPIIPFRSVSSLPQKSVSFSWPTLSVEVPPLELDAPAWPAEEPATGEACPRLRPPCVDPVDAAFDSLRLTLAELEPVSVICR
jgi:hypothetical protein